MATLHETSPDFGGGDPEAALAVVRGLPSLPAGAAGGVHVHIDDLQRAVRRAFTLGRIT